MEILNELTRGHDDGQQQSSTVEQKALIFSAVQHNQEEMVKLFLSDVQGQGGLGRVPKTWVAGWHCHPESFCASGKFLRVTIEIALGSFRMVWKVSR